MAGIDMCICYKWLCFCILETLVVVWSGYGVAGENMPRALQCYECKAYDFEKDFESKLTSCENGKTTKTIDCPYNIDRVRYPDWEVNEKNRNNFTLYPSCTVVKQKAAGAVTSYTRGCKLFTNCTDINDCEESMEKSGVCRSCCNTSLCNSAPSSLRRLHGLWPLVAILVAKLASS